MTFKILMISIIMASITCYYLTPALKKAVLGDRKISKNIEIFLTGLIVTCSIVVFYYLITFLAGLTLLAILILSSIICLVI